MATRYVGRYGVAIRGKSATPPGARVVRLRMTTIPGNRQNELRPQISDPARLHSYQAKNSPDVTVVRRNRPGASTSLAGIRQAMKSSSDRGSKNELSEHCDPATADRVPLPRGSNDRTTPLAPRLGVHLVRPLPEARTPECTRRRITPPDPSAETAASSGTRSLPRLESSAARPRPCVRRSST